MGRFWPSGKGREDSHIQLLITAYAPSKVSARVPQMAGTP
jgi:hypothetical protein